MLKNKIFDLTGFEFDGTINETEYNGVYVYYDGKNAKIGYSTKVQKARCYFLLSMKIKNGEKNFEIKEKPVFETCGPMVGVSTGGVMTVDAVKKYIDNIAALGFNMLMLYTEDVYEMPEYPQFGYMRGRYTHDELIAIDDYAFEMGIEVIPCIQTLGHHQNYLRWPEAAKIKEGRTVLLPDEEKTYEFIECEIKTMRKCFRSNRIHLGMDEAVGLGLGKHLKIHGYEKVHDIFNRHVKRVVAIADKYNYQPMIWCDMYYTPDDPLEYYNPDAVIPQEALDSAPEDVGMVFWDYYHTDYEYYHKKFIQQKRFKNNETIFAGGVWTWDGHAPNFRYTYDSTKPALEAAIDHNIKIVIATLWGGGDVDHFKALDGLCAFSEFCYKGKECTEDDVYAAATHISGQSREFIDAVSEYYLGYIGSVRIGTGFFYADPMFNLLNYDVDYDEAIQRYTNALNIIEKHKTHKYYTYYSSLFKVVIEKARIFKSLRKEYKTGNREYLCEFANNTLPKLRRYYKEFYEEFKNHWLEVKKPHSLEKFSMYFGAADYRLSYMEETIKKYLDGSLIKIAELEEDVIGGMNLTWGTKDGFTCVMPNLS